MPVEYDLLPAQRALHYRDPAVSMDFACYQGGYGCVSGDTFISLWNNTEVRIDQFVGGYIKAWNGNSLVKAWATRPAIYDKAPMYRVKTACGLDIVCTGQHKFLARDGWVQMSHLQVGDVVLTNSSLPLKQICSLREGEALSYLNNPAQTNLEYGQSVRAEDVCDSPQIAQDYLDGCSTCCHQYDAQLPSYQGIGLSFVPLQDGALKHIQSLLRLDAHCFGLNDSHPYQLSVHHSSPHFAHRLALHALALAGCRVEKNISEQPSGFYQQLSQFLLSLTPEQRDLLSYQPFYDQSDIALNSLLSHNLTESIIESIEYVNTDYYFDLHVPGYNNYLAQGFINHNSGKTWAGSLLGIRLAERYPGSIGLVVAKTYPMVRDTTLKTYFDHIDALGLVRKKHYEFNKSEGLLKFWNGSEIFFKHLENPEKIKSLTCDWIEIEEMSQLDEADFLMLISRLRGSKGCLRLFGHTNPQAVKGWIYKYFVQGAGKKTDDSGNVIQYRRIVAPTTENKFLPEGYVKNMEAQYSDKYYRQNVLGEDGDYRDGLVVPDWSIANEDSAIVYNPNLPIYLTCDFNVDPMCWEIAHKYGQGTSINYEFFDELAVENTNIIESAREFARRYFRHKAGIIITGDASGKNRSDSSPNPNDTKYHILRQTLSDLGMSNVNLDVPISNPNIDIRIENWNGLVCSRQEVRRIKVNPDKCPKLIWNMHNLKYVPGTSVIYTPSGKQIERDTSNTVKFTGHPFDAASYLTCKYSPVKRDVMPKTTQKFISAEFKPR